MSQIKIDISIIGQNFDSESYARDSESVVLGWFRCNRIPKGICKIPAHDDVHSLWSANAAYIPLGEVSREEWGSAWVEDEQVILNYLDEVVAKLPDVKNYCTGEYSRTLCVVYLETEGRPSGGFFHSPRLFSKLTEMNLFMELIHREGDR